MRVKLLAMLLFLSAAAFGQNYTTVTATQLQGGGQLLPSGTLCFIGTDQNDNPIPFHAGGGGLVFNQGSTAPICTTVLNGVAQAPSWGSTFQVPNPANTSPANIYYRVTLTDGSSGQTVMTLKEVSFSGAAFNLDNYSPIISTFTAPSGSSVSGPFQVTGDLNVTGTLTPGSLSLSSKLGLVASTTAYASVNMPSGVAPTTPVSGDIWNLSGALKYFNGTSTLTLPTLEGNNTFAGINLFPYGTAAAPSIAFSGDTTTGFYHVGAGVVGIAINGVYEHKFDASYFYTPNVYITSASTTLAGDAANTLAQRNGTSAQAWNIYNTYTNSSNYERLSFNFSAGAARIFTNGAGTGSANRDLQLGVANNTYWKVDGGTGSFYAMSDNTKDIGAAAASRPRSIYAGTSIQAPTANLTNANLSDVVIGSAFTAFGDSITACFGIVSSPNCWDNLLATAKGWTITNDGVSGSGITDAGQMDSILATTVTTGNNFTELCCVNDMRNNLTAAQQSDWQSSLEAALLWLAVPDANKIKGNGASVTYSGTWAASASYGGLPFQSIIAGNTATVSVYGTSVYLVSLWQCSNTSTYTVNVDSGAYVTPTIATSAGCYTTFQSRNYGPMVTRISGLSEATHTVVLTCTAAATSNPCYFVFATSGTGAATKLGPNVFVGNTLRFTAAGYTASGGSDSLVAQFNQRISQVATDLSSDGLNVTLVDASGYYTPNGTNTQSDGVHPTDAGDGLVFKAFSAAMPGFILPQDRMMARIFGNLSPCSYNGAFAVGIGCPVNSVRGDLGSAETATSGKVSLGTDGTYIGRSGSTWVLNTGSIAFLQFGGTTNQYPAFKLAGGGAPKITSRLADDSGDTDFEAKGGTFTSLAMTGAITNSAGLQIVRAASSATAATAWATANTTLTWPVAFANTNYTAECNLTGDTGLTTGTPLLAPTYNKTTTTISVQIVTYTAAASSAEIECVGTQR